MIKIKKIGGYIRTKDTKDYYKYELIKAADVLVRDMIKLKKDETLVITLDTESDYRVADAVAGAAHSVGGKPMVISVPTPLGNAKAADKYLPLEPFLIPTINITGG